MHNTEKPLYSVERVMHSHGDMLFRLCLATLANRQDAEDVLQDVMIRYMEKSPVFADAGHEKAWLITVATNRCRDILRTRSKQPAEITDSLADFADSTADTGILDALMTLPEKYRTVLVLYYMEEYSTKEIAKFINRTESAVKMRLKKGRALLRESYRKEQAE